MIEIIADECTGCKTCNWVCPHGVLEMREKKAFIAYFNKCIECGACSLNCPTGAAQVTKRTGCLTIIIKQDILGMKNGTCC